ncbi:MAG: hypothetical protein IKF71_01465 [Bacilli bacterium]|nr:hypothetical protein [Bacilli bacterium]
MKKNYVLFALIVIVSILIVYFSYNYFDDRKISTQDLCPNSEECPQADEIASRHKKRSNRYLIYLVIGVVSDVVFFANISKSKKE